MRSGLFDLRVHFNHRHVDHALDDSVGEGDDEDEDDLGHPAASQKEVHQPCQRR